MSWRRFLWDRVPAQSTLLRSLSQHYIDRCNGENDGNMYTNGEFRLMQSVLPGCATAIDAGANIGEWTRTALEIAPHLHVHCFEPSLTTFRRLAAPDLIDRAKLNNCALSSAPGKLSLHVYGDGSGLNSLYQRRGLEDGWGLTDPSKTEAVDVNTLDNYIEREKLQLIDFLKLDVEGHELEVLRGALRALSEHRIKYIQFEYGGANIDSRVLLKDLFDFLQSRDFSLFKIFPTELHHVPRYDQRLENYQYQNWVAIDPGHTGAGSSE